MTKLTESAIEEFAIKLFDRLNEGGILKIQSLQFMHELPRNARLFVSLSNRWGGRCD